nr:AAA family ATPase [Anaerolineae bacterium]
MTRVISLLSFRRGTGKTHIAASLAAALAARGFRVGLVDADIQSPSLHIVLGISPDSAPGFLNDYLTGDIPGLYAAVLEITEQADISPPGRLYAVISDPGTSTIAKAFETDLKMEQLSRGFLDLSSILHLDYIIADTHSGMNQESLRSLAVSDTALLVLQLDRQHYEGTALLVDMVRELNVSQTYLIINGIPFGQDPHRVRDEAENAFKAEVIGMLPHSNELLEMSSGGIFVNRFPDHPLTVIFNLMAERLAD